MISIKDLAKQDGITYEAVRQLVKRYAAELTGHIHLEGRTQYLDDFAVELLESKRQASPIVIYEASKDEEIARLESENKMLLLKLNETQEKVMHLQDRLLEAASAPAQLVATQTELDGVRSRADEQAQELQRVRTELSGKKQELQDQQAAAQTAASELAEVKSRAEEQAQELEQIRTELSKREQELQELKDRQAAEVERKAHSWIWRLFNK